MSSCVSESGMADIAGAATDTCSGFFVFESDSLPQSGNSGEGSIASFTILLAYTAGI